MVTFGAYRAHFCASVSLILMVNEEQLKAHRWFGKYFIYCSSFIDVMVFIIYELVLVANFFFDCNLTEID